MLSTGIVRRVDELGRVVIPKETREKLDVQIRDCMEIFVEDDKMILQKYQPGCIFCGDMRNNIQFKGRHVCKECINKALGSDKQ